MITEKGKTSTLQRYKKIFTKLSFDKNRISNKVLITLIINKIIIITIPMIQKSLCG